MTSTTDSPASRAPTIPSDAVAALRALPAMPAFRTRMTALIESKSRREIARATGVSTETLRRYLRGDSPSCEFVMALCEEFGVSAHWLMFGSGPLRSSDLPRRSGESWTPGKPLSPPSTREPPI
ncbi:MAG: helix-turn-helix transcriptional regulator [Phycisphaeraceae bacterium]|nr:helix-turn-helix transcriptional regulator [Phycisphaeraceae bacterium]